eukprot:CAMPEP_0173268334 /NCGR_PEP_ID=MMETSP1142-20121109/30273_1 /TAXON_ID=483371 /ORGANISM="non described non described, Strain CCMP2298" /LENGTH=97 /DNA_ID=CAMNT_0014204573 /DNA_START=283 /DNA_END=577 /DNA_ORIENTATION=+
MSAQLMGSSLCCSSGAMPSSSSCTTSAQRRPESAAAAPTASAAAPLPHTPWAGRRLDGCARGAHADAYGASSGMLSDRPSRSVLRSSRRKWQCTRQD